MAQQATTEPYRQRHYLTKALVREAVERCFEALADDIAAGEWVDLPGIGKIHVLSQRASNLMHDKKALVQIIRNLVSRVRGLQPYFKGPQ